jgi:hypothetical protein
MTRTRKSDNGFLVTIVPEPGDHATVNVALVYEVSGRKSEYRTFCIVEDYYNNKKAIDDVLKLIYEVLQDCKKQMEPTND